MRKLKLDLEALDVESFEIPDEEDARRGTVHGRVEYTNPIVCDTAEDCSLQSCPTYCATGCAGSCYETCEFTCQISCHYGSSCG